MKRKLLLGANLSPGTAKFLRSLTFDVKSLIEDGLGYITDGEVAKIAEEENRVLITFDLGFGEMHYFSIRKNFNVIMIRTSDQRIENVNELLEVFFHEYRKVLKTSKGQLIILSESSVRIIS